MVADQKTRKVQAELLAAGFHPVRSDGSHTWWTHATGVGVSLPDGHRSVSPGVYRRILKTITEALERSTS